MAIKPIRDQVLVITGASSGIGRITAREAARRGARVVLAARNEHDLNEVVEEIRAEGGEAIAFPTDVTDSARVEALARRAALEYGRIDTWVNNAGVSLYGTFKEIPLEDFRQVLETNFIGQVHGARAALPYLEDTAGALICVGSALSDRGVPLQTAYCAAKHAIKGWLDGLRIELQKEGSPVRVTLVKPSSVNTPLFEKARTYLGVKPMPIPPVYAPELAADAILHAAESNEREIFVGGAGKALSLAERASPKLVDLELRRSAFRKQQTREPESPYAPHNLFSAMEHDGGVRGEFTKEKKRSYVQRVEEHSVAASFAAAAALGLGAIALKRARPRDTLPAAFLGAGALLLAGKGTLAATYER